jgi:hypothetical protein
MLVAADADAIAAARILTVSNIVDLRVTLCPLTPPWTTTITVTFLSGGFHSADAIFFGTHS